MWANRGLLRILTAATPKVGNYHFTTIIPSLGVLRLFDRDIVLADVPGILPGASHGVGLGIQFLKHISRTRAFAIIVSLETDDAALTFQQLLTELYNWDRLALTRPRIVLANKLDLPGAQQRLEQLEETLKNERIVGLSVITREKLPAVVEQITHLTAQASPCVLPY